MATITAATEQNYLVTAVVDGQALGTFDTFSGGEPAAKEVKHRPGGMGPEVSYATLPSYSAITISRVLEPARDWELIRSLTQKTGRVTFSCTVQPLDADGNVWGNPKTYNGTFLGIKDGKTDSTSDALRMVEIDASCTVVS